MFKHLGPQPSRIILQRAKLRTTADNRDAIAGVLSSIGGGAVPKPRIESEGGAGWANGGNRRDFVRHGWIRKRSGEMARRHDASGPAFLREVGDHPHDVGGRDGRNGSGGWGRVQRLPSVAADIRR